ncbi:MAG: haloalkane dehalogenase [Robiginitomaculum sp.]|nr:MAG: haloalkane dehalogenase [Robiginitomaculum sp.]
MANVLRTPDDRFAGLRDYDFDPHYVTVEDEKLGALRLHYVDEGPKDGRLIIMMHGEPSWSYLYRHMIKAVAAAGFRVLAPDLIGFGRSDKPADIGDYSYSGHVSWMLQWLRAMELKDAVLFCQDWGGLIGLRLVAAEPDMFAGVIAANTFLPTGEGQMPESFKKWKEFSQTVPEFPVGNILKGAVVKPLSDDSVAAYNAPYPDESYKAGARIFPALVPVSEDMDGAQDNREAWKILGAFEKPFLTCFSDQDPITNGLDKIFQKNVPGCAGQPHQILEGGGHFLQEDLSAELSDILVAFMGRL